jgi:hypothetical protein
MSILATVSAWLRRHEAQRRQDRAASIRRLLDAAERALSLQPAAEEVVRACAAHGEVPAAVARRGGPLVSEFWRLREEAIGLRLPPDLEPARERLCAQLQYHQLMVQEALNMAFSAHSQARGGLRHRAAGLGATGAALSTVAADLRSRLQGDDEAAQ